MHIANFNEPAKFQIFPNKKSHPVKGGFLWIRLFEELSLRQPGRAQQRLQQQLQPFRMQQQLRQRAVQP